MRQDDSADGDFARTHRGTGHGDRPYRLARECTEPVKPQTKPERAGKIIGSKWSAFVWPPAGERLRHRRP